jgi:hypothetical protein
MDEVIRMSRAGLAEDIIISRIDQRIDLSVDQLIELKNAGVSDRIIRAMLTQVPSKKSSTPEVKDASVDHVSVKEVGFYLIDKEPILLTSSAFTNQKASMVKLAATMGLGKVEQKASVQGASAKLRTDDRSPSFVFYAPEGVAATEYLLIRLDRKSDHREITVGRMNMLGASAGFEKKRIINFASTKVNARRWKITLDKPLTPGEYGFYPAAGLQTVGSAVSMTGKLYEFGID